MSIKLNTNILSKKITEILNEETINKIAKDCNFIIRERKLSGFEFLDMLLFTHFNHKELSLNDLSVQLKSRFGIIIKKQSIDDRFTKAAVRFFKTVLEGGSLLFQYTFIRGALKNYKFKVFEITKAEFTICK